MNEVEYFLTGADSFRRVIMREFVENVLRQLREFFGKLSRKDKIRLAILATAVIILAIVVVSLLNRTTYATLYTAQSNADAGIVQDALLEMGERVEISGRSILVPEDRVDELRNRLAAQGVIESNDMNYDILNSAAGFNITESHAKRLYDAQKALEIRTQILRIEKVQSAIVTVTSGETTPFVVSTGARDATAAVMLSLRGGTVLTPAEVQVIADLVTANVSGLKPENLSITDSKLNHYIIGDGNVDLGTEINSRIALRNYLQQLLQEQGERIVTPIYGLSNTQVTASVTLNFDRRITESVEFFPPIPGEEEGIVRSSHELYENSRRDGAAEGIPGTDTNAMGTVEYPYGTLADGYEYAKAIIEKNFEIDETRTMIEHEQGVVQAASISVLIDREAVSEDYTEEVRNLVSKGLGIHPDNVAVERVPFTYHGTDYGALIEEMQALQEQERRKEIIQMVLVAAVILLLGLALISLAKSIVRAVRGPEPEEELALVDGGIDYLADDDLSEEEYVDDVELNTKSTALEQIERFIDKDPVSVAQLLRNWLTDE